MKGRLPFIHHSSLRIHHSLLLRDVRLVEVVGLVVNGDAAASSAFIETVPKRGYRFIAPVRRIHADEGSLSINPDSSPAAVFNVEVFNAGSRQSSAAAPNGDERVAPAAAQRRAIAVLPFKITGSCEEDDEYLGMGLADALVTRLCNVRELVVRPTSAAARYASPEQDI
jgi:hypothetical protein